MGSDSSGSGAVTKCGAAELVIFAAAIVTGTACSICSKTMMQLHATGSTGEVEAFTKPIFQTFGMFVGMTFGLVMHWVVLRFSVPFPGYQHGPMPAAGGKVVDGGGKAAATEQTALLPQRRSTFLDRAPSSMPETPAWMFYFLAVPAFFDLAATALCMLGLRYIDVSVYQLLRGSGIIFVALMKQYVLGHRLYNFQWVGVAFNLLSVLLVGATAVLNSHDDDAKDPSEALLGVVLVMAGAFVQALQFVFEEKVMTLDDDAAPPLLVIGMEGLWGTVLCLLVVYPLVYFLPGSDHGSYEDPFNTWYMLTHSALLQFAFAVYFVAIFGYNLFAVLVTYALNSVWHAILDNFRPLTVWATDLFIFYGLPHLSGHGEPWTPHSWVQLMGMGVLLYGTAIYNAPNAGSIRLEGAWWQLGLDLRHEYGEIELEVEQAAGVREDEDEDRWEERLTEFKQRRLSSFAARSPMVSVHTQALHGLGSHNI